MNGRVWYHYKDFYVLVTSRTCILCSRNSVSHVHMSKSTANRSTSILAKEWSSPPDPSDACNSERTTWNDCQTDQKLKFIFIVKLWKPEMAPQALFSHLQTPDIQFRKTFHPLINSQRIKTCFLVKNLFFLCSFLYYFYTIWFLLFLVYF